MSSFQFEPYEEVDCQVSKSGELTLRLPWVQIEMEYAADDQDLFESIAQDINQQKPSDKVSDLLSAVHENFVAYSQPRQLSLNLEHGTRSINRVQRLENANPSAWCESYLPGIQHLLGSEKWEWEWNVHSILEKSKIIGLEAYDPESAYRAIMRLVLIDMCSPQRGPKLLVDHLRHLARADEVAFFEAAQLFVRQYHHITSTSSDCLMPALYNMPYAKEQVMELVHEEQGHGHFTSSSFKELGGQDILSLPVDPYTFGLMDLLKVAAHTNALAFSTLFTIFEVSGEQDDDPLATLLNQSSKPKSGKGLQTHFQLNKDGAHFQSGFPLIQTLQAIDKESVIEAARFAELLMKFFDLSALGIVRSEAN